MSLEAWGDGGDESYWNSEEVSEIASNTFRQGAQAMRELILRELAGHGLTEAANKIRDTWYHYFWGEDPGKPDDVAQSEDW